MFRSFPRPSSGQHLIVKGTINVLCTLWDSMCLHNVRKTIIKVLLLLLLLLLLLFTAIESSLGGSSPYTGNK